VARLQPAQTTEERRKSGRFTVNTDGIDRTRRDWHRSFQRRPHVHDFKDRSDLADLARIMQYSTRAVNHQSSLVLPRRPYAERHYGEILLAIAERRADPV
jgi:hypothetical protein